MNNYDQWKLEANDDENTPNECDCGKHIQEDEQFCSDRCWRENNES